MADKKSETPIKDFLSAAGKAALGTVAEPLPLKRKKKKKKRKSRFRGPL